LYDKCIWMLNTLSDDSALWSDKGGGIQIEPATNNKSESSGRKSESNLTNKIWTFHS
jgi:hypothetical protein